MKPIEGNVFERPEHRFALPSDEQRDIEHLWQEVQDKTGVHVKSKPATVDPEALIISDPLDVNVDLAHPQVYYALGVTDLFTDDQLSGILAHELGHLAEKKTQHSHTQAFETAADKWAATHGYGEKLISALENADHLVQDLQLSEDPTDHEHPETAVRVAIIRAAEPKS